jgi:hypothetical protein
MLGLANTFDVQETGIESTEPFHVPMLGAISSRRTQLSGTATVSANWFAAMPETDNRPPTTSYVAVMSLVDIALLPIRVGLGVADAVLQAVTPAPPAPPSELVVIDGMPEGVPPAALRPEPRLPAPAGWPFGEEFPRTCGTRRFAGGALFWTDFVYDDHGATGVLIDIPTGGLVPPRGTYVYPGGPAARNGADIFRVAIAGLTVDVARAGLASLSASTINVATDTFTQIRLGALPPDATVRLDGEPTGPLVQVPVGRHTITLTTTSVRSAALVPLSAIAARR